MLSSASEDTQMANKNRRPAKLNSASAVLCPRYNKWDRDHGGKGPPEKEKDNSDPMPSMTTRRYTIVGRFY